MRGSNGHAPNPGPAMRGLTVDGKRTRRRLTGSAAVALLALAMNGAAPSSPARAADPAGTAATYDFAIPAKPLAQALDDFGRVTGMSVLQTLNGAEGRTAPAVSGEMTADQALTLLLSGGAARHHFINATTVAVEAPMSDAGSDDALRLGPVVVSAAGYEMSLRDAPASISVIGQAELERTPVRDLTDLLGKVEGVTLRRAGNQTTPQIRGFDSNYVLMMIDGKRVDTTTPVFRGNDYDTGWVPAEDIDRVEVVRGPMSSLYGSDAVGGVINIITKKPGDKWTATVDGGYTAQENREAGDSYKMGFIASGPIVKDQLSMKLSGGYDRRLADDDVNPIPPGGGTPFDGFLESANKHMDARLMWTPDPRHDISVDAAFSDRLHGDQTLLRRSGGVNYKGGFDFGSVEAKVYGDEIRNLTGNITGGHNPNTSYSMAADGKVVLPLDIVTEQMLTVGGDVRHEKLKDPYTITGLPGTSSYGAVATESVLEHSLFIEDDITITEGLRLTLGDRYDHHEKFGGHHSPRVYALYHLNDAVTFRAGWAEAFKAPTLLQNSPNWGSVSCGSATNGCYIIGSADLKPETSISKELGVSVEYGWIGGGLTVFRNDLKNMIDITNRTRDPVLAVSYDNFVGFLPDGRPIFAYQNIAKARTQGVELSFHWTPREDVNLRATYTYLDAKNLSYSYDLPLVYRPKHSANVDVDWAVDERLSLSLGVEVVGSQYVTVPTSGNNMRKQEGFVTMDLAAAYQLTDNLILRGGVLNIADRVVERTTSNEFNVDGRRYFVSAAAKF